MSVPKRFKTKVQKKGARQSSRVLVKTNTAVQTFQGLIFIHNTRKKKIENTWLNYLIKE